ncbi:MAG: extracellular solute-binding protein [Propionibacteriaceae bacterium]|jgi:xylobiose transport system substrate-binding protein|nr:extracellular solute-binding protein [Propionibacteriaceae bacterium]
MTKKRKLRALAITFALASSLAMVGCAGDPGPVDDGTSDGACESTSATTIWRLEDNTQQPLIEAVDRFKENWECGPLELQLQTNQGYLDKVRSAMNGNGRPGVWQNWGAGNIKDYLEADLVVDLQGAFDADPNLKAAFMPAVLEPAAKDGKYYGIPVSGTQPVLLFYNKTIFAEHGLNPPETFDDLLAAVEVLKAEGIIPIALSGQQTWTIQMYWQWLVDRVGGPEVFQRVANGDWQGGWSDPAVLRATEMIYQLVEVGAFGDNYASVSYGAGGTETLMTEGRAAMYLMGSWAYGSMKSTAPGFVADDLGYINPPAVTGGKGDPGNVAGNPTTYLSISVSANQETANAFLSEMYSDAYIRSIVAQGEVPVTNNADKYINEAADPEFFEFQLNLVKSAKAFQQSWDTAIGDDAMTPVKAEMQRLILKQIDPQGFVDAVLELEPDSN